MPKKFVSINAETSRNAFRPEFEDVNLILLPRTIAYITTTSSRIRAISFCIVIYLVLKVPEIYIGLVMAVEFKNNVYAPYINGLNVSIDH